MIATGGGLEVDAEPSVPCDLLSRHLECDSERACSSHRVVRVEVVAETLDLQAPRQLLGSVRAERNHREAQRRELGLDLAQLAELRVAVGSPAAAVEDQQRAGALHEFSQVDLLPGDRPHMGRRNR